MRQLSTAIVAVVVFESRVLCSNAKGGSVTWITPKPIVAPTEAPTYEFPSSAPVSIQLLKSSQPTEPPFFTSLPTTPPSLDHVSTGAKPANDTPAVGGEKPKLFNASKSAKDPKASKIPPSTPKKTPPAIQSPTSSPSASDVSTVNPSSAPQRFNSSSKSDCASAKWHPNLGFNMCTNSHEYPNHWVSTPAMQRHYFRATLEQCCSFVFGPIGVCEFEDVCTSASPSVSPSISSSDAPSGGPSASPSDSMTQRPSLEASVRKEIEFPTVEPSPNPSSAPSLVFRDTLPPTVPDASTSSPTIGVDPVVGSSQPRAPVICTCSSTGDVILHGTSAGTPSEAPTSSFPTSTSNSTPLLNTRPPFYTSLPTSSPSSLPESAETSVKSYISVIDEDSSEFNGFLITSQKETECTKVDISEACRLECVVTIKLFHEDVLLHKPTLVKYEASCPDSDTVSTRTLETRVLPADKVDN